MKKVIALAALIPYVAAQSQLWGQCGVRSQPFVSGSYSQSFRRVSDGAVLPPVLQVRRALFKTRITVVSDDQRFIYDIFISLLICCLFP